MSDFKLFDFEYEFDDNSFKKEIEQAIEDHYYFSEIGQETPDRFKHRFKTLVKRIMPYYNELHNTTLLEYDPLINYKLKENLEQLRNLDSNEDTTGNRTGEEETTSKDKEESDSTRDLTTNEEIESSEKRTDDLKHTDNADERTSDYPQQSINDGDFLSGARITENDGTNTGTVDTDGESTTVTTTNETTNSNRDNEGSTQSEHSESTTQNRTKEDTENTEYEKTIEGLTGKTYQELVKLERENMVRIMDLIIEELKPLFIMVY